MASTASVAVKSAGVSTYPWVAHPGRRQARAARRAAAAVSVHSQTSSPGAYAAGRYAHVPGVRRVRGPAARRLAAAA